MQLKYFAVFLLLQGDGWSFPFELDGCGTIAFNGCNGTFDALIGFDLVPDTGPRTSLRNHGFFIAVIGRARHIKPESVEDSICCFFQVQSVEVQDIDTNFNQILAHLCSKFDAEGFDAIWVVLETIHLGSELSGNTSFAELRHFDKAGVRIDTHETGNNRTVDTPLSAILNKCSKNLCVEEHLSDDEVTSGVDLLLQIIHLLFVIIIEASVYFALIVCRTSRLFGFRQGGWIFDKRDGIRVAFWVTRNTDTKVGSEIFSDVFDKIQRASETAIGSSPFLLSMGRISTQRNNIDNAIVFGSFKGTVDGLFGVSILFHVRACHVHVGNVSGLFELLCNVEGQISRRTSSSPSYIAKEWVDGGFHALHASVQVLHTRLRSWREKLDGDKRLAAIFLLVDQINDLWVARVFTGHY
mmetsp:Transcript_739/g.1785  ORF Transcript_739/g.1785 Transcript_739/m.1785 type:complete len:411 (+) Transcript_739:794-2026(+)